MPRPRSDDDKPVMGERVEVWDGESKDWSVHEIRRVLHMGMKGWTIETSMGLFMDVIPVSNGITKPHWREWRKDG